MQRCGPTERDHHVVGDILAVLHRMDPRGIRHVLVDHLGDAESRRLHFQRELRANLNVDRFFSGAHVENDRASREIPSVNLAQHQIGVGYSRARPAQSVAGWAWLRPSTLGAGLDAAQRINRRDGPAASTDLNHLDHGNGDRDARPLGKAVGARHLKSARCARGELLDQADLRRSAAHIVGDHLAKIEAASNVGCKDRAPCRARLDQAHREFRRRLDRHKATTRVDQKHRAPPAHLPKSRLQAQQVIGHQRAHVSVGADRVEALKLAHLRRYVGADGDRQVKPRGKELARPPLV